MSQSSTWTPLIKKWSLMNVLLSSSVVLSMAMVLFVLYHQQDQSTSNQAPNTESDMVNVAAGASTPTTSNPCGNGSILLFPFPKNLGTIVDGEMISQTGTWSSKAQDQVTMVYNSGHAGDSFTVNFTASPIKIHKIYVYDNDPYANNGPLELQINSMSHVLPLTANSAWLTPGYGKNSKNEYKSFVQNQYIDTTSLYPSVTSLKIINHGNSSFVNFCVSYPRPPISPLVPSIYPTSYPTPTVTR